MKLGLESSSFLQEEAEETSGRKGEDGGERENKIIMRDEPITPIGLNL